MTAADLALQGIVALAAAMQAITGIGFAMIAGPFILLANASGAPIQVTSLLSLLISAALAPTVWRQIDWPSLRIFTLGALTGLPLGLLLFWAVSSDVLKLIAGLTVAGLTWLSFRSRSGNARDVAPSSRSDWAVAGLSGLFGGCLAMPGPTAAARMNARGFPKETTRATIPAFFLFVYPMIIGMHASVLGGLSAATQTALWLAPGALAGALLGVILSPRVSERFFRNMVLLLLVATAAALLVAAAQGLATGD